ncbi:alpha-L-rhamnosidase C-terminal domain-containing protein [Parabacteroides sp. PF5-6]|uniref:alpha-L-rhamnosidase C-terminal domain-containing protein n=1 Tax=Parabacteroides sp. PF5-6 TaxID=1742403 RepID=UPI00240645D9|nr:alpha-L-rhamnosidase C-terminal domain-containing protein [Parabacteroides sp. PF5-6]
MTYARGHYDSMYGRIESSWEKKGDKYHYRFVVPANTSATLYLPAVTLEQVKEKDRPTGLSEAVTFRTVADGKVVLELQSGCYEFVVE